MIQSGLDGPCVTLLALLALGVFWLLLNLELLLAA